MNAYLANIRVLLPCGTSKVVQTLVYTRNPNDAKLLLDVMFGCGNVLSKPVKMPAST